MCFINKQSIDRKVVSLSLGPAGVVGGGVNVQHSLSTFSTTTEVRPLSKAPNPRLLPGRRSINGCPLLRVCVHGVCVCGCVFTVCVCVGVCSRCVCVCSRCVCALWMALAGGQYSLSTVSDVF